MPGNALLHRQQRGSQPRNQEASIAFPAPGFKNRLGQEKARAGRARAMCRSATGASVGRPGSTARSGTAALGRRPVRGCYMPIALATRSDTVSRKPVVDCQA